jgi:hypothetical protein
MFVGRGSKEPNILLAVINCYCCTVVMSIRRYDSIESLAAILSIGSLLKMSAAGYTSEQLATMRYIKAQEFGMTEDEFMRLKNYFRSHEEGE